MPARGRLLPAVVAAAVMTLLWQLVAELRHLAVVGAVSTGSSPSLLAVPNGSLWSWQVVVRAASGAAIVGLVVTGIVILAVALLLVRTVVARPVARRWVTFLSAWMALVLAATVATAAALPFFVAYLRLPETATEMIANQLVSLMSGAVYSGLVLGLLPALLVALMARPDHLDVGYHPGAAGAPTAPSSALSDPDARSA